MHTLCKEERLCGKQIISDLFGTAHTFFSAPYKVFWLKCPEVKNYPVCFLVSVPKRRFKRAVKRNLMKRRTREVFRTNKQILNTSIQDGQQVRLMLIYASDKLLPVTTLDAAIKKIMHQIIAYAESD